MWLNFLYWFDKVIPASGEWSDPVPLMMALPVSLGVRSWMNHLHCFNQGTGMHKWALEPICTSFAGESAHVKLQGNEGQRGGALNDQPLFAVPFKEERLKAPRFCLCFWLALRRINCAHASQEWEQMQGWKWQNRDRVFSLAQVGRELAPEKATGRKVCRQKPGDSLLGYKC